MFEAKGQSNTTRFRNPDAIPWMSDECFLNMEQDGFPCVIETGEVYQGMWDASSSIEGYLMIAGTDQLPMKIADGTLSFSTDGKTTR